MPAWLSDKIKVGIFQAGVTWYRLNRRLVGLKDRIMYHISNNKFALISLIFFIVSVFAESWSLWSFSSYLSAISVISFLISVLYSIYLLQRTDLQSSDSTDAKIFYDLKKDDILIIGESAVWTKKELNLKLEKMTNKLKIEVPKYTIPDELKPYTFSVFRGKSIPLLAINENKIRIRTDITSFILDSSISPIKIQKTTYFDGLMTNEICDQMLVWRRPTSIPNERVSVACDFSKFFFANRQLITLEESKASNHSGGSILVLTRDAKLVYQIQGKENLIDPGKLSPTASGSFDWQDINANSDFKSLIICGMERELVEETSAIVKDDKSHHTYLTGYCRVLHRGGKPEFCGLTLLNQSYEELRVKPREDGFVSRINHFQLTGLRLSEVRDGLRKFQKFIYGEKYGYALQFTLKCAIDFLDQDSNTDEPIADWFNDRAK